MKPPRRWTDAEITMARELRATGVSFHKIGLAIGRDKGTVLNKLAGQAHETRRKSAQTRYRKLTAAPAPFMNRVLVESPAPTAIMVERDTRMEAASRRTLTQVFCGDPPPGFSALDEKRAPVVAAKSKRSTPTLSRGVAR